MLPVAVNVPADCAPARDAETIIPAKTYEKGFIELGCLRECQESTLQ